MKKFSFIFWTVVGISAMVQAQGETVASSKFQPKYFCELNSGMLTMGDFRGFTHIKNGVSLHPKVDVSLGLGVEGHSTGRYLPIFLEGRYNFLTSKTRPFVSLNAGYLQVIEDWTYGNWNTKNNKHIGFSTGARFGVQQQISGNVSFVTSVGYRFSRVQYEQRNDIWWPGPNLPVEPMDPTTIIHHMNRFELSIGFLFK